MFMHLQEPILQLLLIALLYPGRRRSVVSGAEAVSKSFPAFVETLRGLGAEAQ